MRSHGNKIGVLGLGVVAVFLFLGAAAFAYGQHARGPVQQAQTDKDNRYTVTILVSNEEDEDTPVHDPLLQNAWGIAALPGGPWWVNDNATGFATIYKGDGTKLPLEVSGLGKPTGIVANTSGSFRFDEATPAKFIFVSEDGTFTAWASGNTATVVHNEPESIYKGLAILGSVLYTTNFSGCEVEAYQGDFFNQTFDEFDTVGGFHDGTIPGGYCPFGIQAIGDSIFVSYAKKNGDDDEAGQGHGFVREFDQFGQLVSRVGSHGTLNSPWGMAMAPEGFGKFGGCLLVGNFGDGRISAFCKNEGGIWHQSGRLKEGAHLLTIDGLWGIGFGNDGLAGPSDTLYFAAGPDDEANGYYGSIEFTPKN
jgi:uncharacterized protein (TIGR03118 family)